MIKNALHDLVLTDTTSHVSNGQTPGIGRLERVFDNILINNLGRNIQFCSKHLDTLAIFGETVYPQLDDESQFDLDMHAFLELEDSILAINHYGLIRLFKRPDRPVQWHEPWTTAKWPGDVERFAIAQGCLISTSPQGYSVRDPAQPGILISQALASRLEPNPRRDPEPASLPYEVVLADWGITTALAVCPEQNRLAVAARQRIGLFSYQFDGQRLSLTEPIYERHSDFIACQLAFTPDGNLLAAGYAAELDGASNQDWDRLGGGGWLLLSMDGKELANHRLTIDNAWGNGADPLIFAPQLGTIFGIDKFAGLHSWKIDSGKYQLLSRASEPKPIGMAHATIIDRTVLCGFNRDGYRIHRYII